MTAPIKTCDYCCAGGVMPTFMDGETVCYDCLPRLPKTLREAWHEIISLRTKIEHMEKQEPVGKFIQHPSHGMWEQDGYGDNPDAKPLYALPGAQPAPSVPDEAREWVMAAIAQALGNAYDCTRVWEAWSYGTMDEDDFSLIAEDSDRLREIADAAIMAMGASAPKPDAA